MKNALIGYTGFIGSHLKEKIKNCKYYNSKNIKKIKNKKFNKIYFSGNDSRIWYVNKYPKKDMKNLISILSNLSSVKCNLFILISSIEIYKSTKNKKYDENSKLNYKKKLNYGKNRLFFEKEIKKLFNNHLIIRLPVVYGKRLKKNVLFDIIHNNNLSNINTSDVLQFYPVKYLYSDINKIIKNKIKLINLSSAPIRIATIFKKFHLKMNNHNSYRNYNMVSIFSKIFKKKYYRFSKIEIINDIFKFIREYK